MNSDFWMKLWLKGIQIPFICVHLWLKTNFKTLSKMTLEEFNE